MGATNPTESNIASQLDPVEHHLLTACEGNTEGTMFLSVFQDVLAAERDHIDMVAGLGGKPNPERPSRDSIQAWINTINGAQGNVENIEESARKAMGKHLLDLIESVESKNAPGEVNLNPARRLASRLTGDRSVQPNKPIQEMIS